MGNGENFPSPTNDLPLTSGFVATPDNLGAGNAPVPVTANIPTLGQVVAAGAAAGAKITNVTDPAADQDAATKKYVDDQIVGAAPDIAKVLGTGDDAAGASLVNISTLTATEVLVVQLLDGSASPGTAAQVPIANGTGGWLWTDPAPAVVTSPLDGATVAGGTGGAVAFDDAPGAGAGGDATLEGGTNSNGRAGGSIKAKGGNASGFSGRVELATLNAHINIDGNQTDGMDIEANGPLTVTGSPVTVAGGGVTGIGATLKGGPGNGGFAGGDATLRGGTGDGGSGTGASIVAKGGSAAGASGLIILSPALPSSDPGIPGALYETAGAVMISL